MRKPQNAMNFEFEIIPIEEVPLRRAIVYPPEDQHGSEYDRMLRALADNPGRAVKITAKNSVRLADLTIEERRKIQSGLITISKNGRVHKLCTQVNSDAVYAFIEEE